MSKRLEDFVRSNREAFDSEEPNPLIWNRLEEQLRPGSNVKKISGRIYFRWAIAAALTGLVALCVIYTMNRQPQKTNPVAQTTTTRPESNENIDLLNEINPSYAKEVSHFTQLIELKQSELKQIEKDQPKLYQQFIGDITKLDSMYNALQKDLPENPNREQLLEAMIQNLKLQTELLNQQLLIIQKIKQAKNNENNSKSI
jgi:hypothetical protein